MKFCVNYSLASTDYPKYTEIEANTVDELFDKLCVIKENSKGYLEVNTENFKFYLINYNGKIQITGHKKCY